MAPVIDAIAACSSAVSAATHVVQLNPFAQLPLKLQGNSIFQHGKHNLWCYYNSQDILMEPQQLHHLLLPKTIILYQIPIIRFGSLKINDPTSNDGVGWS